ncbi:tyrosine-type recombinase/integrase [Brucella pituitosa]|uniref:Site-specific integrase n=1 Tax=Brucella pituitosa TaxID=571256 RepID=A0A643EZY1_9HYPH|nr:site-specific integrase [Brucella pituitosa]KAB0571294.1 site-specific integrase [Brucella pituitosa]
MSAGNLTIKDMVERHASGLWGEGSHRKGAMAFLYEISEIIPEPFSEFKKGDFDQIIEALQKRKNRNSTINRKINALTKLLRYAVTTGELPNVPVYKRLDEHSNQLRFLSSKEEHLIINSIATRSKPYAALTSLLVETGVTLGEAIAIRWESIQPHKIRIVESSIGLGRTLPLTKKAKNAIEEMKTEAKGPFCGIEQPKYRGVWNEVKLEVGLEDSSIVPTILRHTCAARLAKRGIDLRIVQKWLGNRNYKSMIRYETLVSPDNFALCLAALETADYNE